MKQTPSESLLIEAGCEHLRAITELKRATRRECAECVKIGSTWVHLAHMPGVRCHALLRRFSAPARKASRENGGTSGRCIGRAGRAMVVLLPR